MQPDIAFPSASFFGLHGAKLHKKSATQAFTWIAELLIIGDLHIFPHLVSFLQLGVVGNFVRTAHAAAEFDFLASQRDKLHMMPGGFRALGKLLRLSVAVRARAETG